MRRDEASFQVRLVAHGYSVVTHDPQARRLRLRRRERAHLGLRAAGRRLRAAGRLRAASRRTYRRGVASSAGATGGTSRRTVVVAAHRRRRGPSRAAKQGLPASHRSQCCPCSAAPRRADGSRRRRGCDVDIPRRRVAATTPRPRRRGYFVATGARLRYGSRGPAVAAAARVHRCGPLPGRRPPAGRDDRDAG